MRRLGVAAGALLISVGGCSLFTSLSGFDEAADRPADDGGGGADATGGDANGGATDATPSSDSGSDAVVRQDSSSDGPAGDDAGVQLVVNGTFETGTCAPFMHNPSKATISASTNARTGTYACLVCNTGAPTGTAGIWQDFAPGALGAGKYAFGAYVRTDGDAGNSLGQVQITVKKNVGGAARYPSYQTTTTAAGWARLEVVVDVAADEFLAGFLVGLYSDTTGPCVVFDDVSFVKN
jgi:hypothetical protein